MDVREDGIRQVVDRVRESIRGAAKRLEGGAMKKAVDARVILQHPLRPTSTTRR